MEGQVLGIKGVPMATVIRFRVSLIGSSGLYRILDAASDAKFKDLHDAIFGAFDRDDPHLYSFYMTGTDTKDIRRIRRSPEIAAPEAGLGSALSGFSRPNNSAAKVRVGDVELEPGDVFHYLFDYGDEWWHRIQVEAVMEVAAGKRSVVLVKSVGASPSPYPDFD